MHRTPLDVLEAGATTWTLRFIVDPRVGRVPHLVEGGDLLPDPDGWTQKSPWRTEVTGSLLDEVERLVLFSTFVTYDQEGESEETLTVEGRVVAVEAHGDNRMVTMVIEGEAVTATT